MASVFTTGAGMGHDARTPLGNPSSLSGGTVGLTTPAPAASPAPELHRVAARTVAGRIPPALFVLRLCHVTNCLPSGILPIVNLFAMWQCHSINRE